MRHRQKRPVRKASVLVIAGNFMGQVIPIPPEGLVFGRDPARCNLVIQSPAVSRLHARLVGSVSGGVVLEDLNSTNGVYILRGAEWMRMTAPVSMAPGGRFRLGDENNEFEIHRGE